jgi:hypothetical protein
MVAVLPLLLSLFVLSTDCYASRNVVKSPPRTVSQYLHALLSVKSHGFPTELPPEENNFNLFEVNIGMKESDEIVEALRYIQGHAKLNTFGLWRSTWQPGVFEKILPSLTEMQLETFHLQDVTLTHQDAQCFSLLKNMNLISLHLQNLTMHQSAFDSLVTSLHSLSTLKRFQLNNYQLSAENLKKLTDSLQNMKLEFLSLENCDIKEFPDLKMSSLTELRLPYNQITFQESHDAMNLRKLTGLRILRLNSNQISKGIESLIQSMKYIDLNQLFLSKNPLGIFGSVFANEFKDLEKIQWLTLRECNIPQDTLTLLKSLAEKRNFERIDLGDAYNYCHQWKR